MERRDSEALRHSQVPLPAAAAPWLHLPPFEVSSSFSLQQEHIWSLHPDQHTMWARPRETHSLVGKKGLTCRESTANLLELQGKRVGSLLKVLDKHPNAWWLTAEAALGKVYGLLGVSSDRSQST